MRAILKGIFERIFRRKKTVVYGLYNESVREGTARENDIVAAIADKVAKQASMFSPRLIRQGGDEVGIRDTKLSRLLMERPCPEYSTANFLYKMVSDLYYTSNAVAVIMYNDDYTEVESIHPVSVKSIEIIEGKNREFFARFVWAYDGNEYTLPLSQIIHIPARLDKKRFLGTVPDDEIGKTMGLFQSLCNSAAAIAKNSAIVRGILKAAQLVREPDKKEAAKEFREAFFNAENSGGVAVVDNRYSWQEINQKNIAMPTTAIEFFKQSILRYYGVSEGVLLGTASENEMGNFYEGVIAPLALQFSLEFTYKLLTPRERARGNRIEFKADRLQYTSLKTRMEEGKEAFDRGMITINEYRVLLGYSPIADGDVRMVSLNYVQADKQNEYQLGEKGGDNREKQSEDI